jgi:FAD synthetase
MKVLIFGSFDIIHKGHEFLIKKASEYGEVHVVIARDETITKIKNRPPHFTQEERLEHIKAQPLVHNAYIGNLGDKYAIIEKIQPDIICLGYDQKDFTDKLKSECEARGLSIRIIRLPAFEPNKYKSSIFRREKESKL